MFSQTWAFRSIRCSCSWLDALLVLLLVLTAARCVSSSSRIAGRILLQDESQTCPVANCASGCFYLGNVWRCAVCASGFESADLQRVCVCMQGTRTAPGGRSCTLCPRNYYCTNGTARRCPATLRTTGLGAKSLDDCVNPPGTRFVPHPTQPRAELCGDDEYSLGLERQTSCTACPAGLKTDPSDLRMRTSATVCKAPPGYFMLSGAATPCPAGSFAPGYTSSDNGSSNRCTSCAAQRSEGLTTNGTASTAVTDCFVLQPGYAALTVSGLVLTSAISSRGDLNNVKAKLCPQGYYCPGGDPTANSSLPRRCPTGMRTLTEGATSSYNCMAPPGWRWNNNTGVAEECGDGYFKRGWNNMVECTPCGIQIAAANGGIGWRSDGTEPVTLYDPIGGSAYARILTRGSPDSCYIGPGMGRVKDGGSPAPASSQLKAVACPANYFGTSSEKLYGQSVVMCLPCPVNQVTACPAVDTNGCAANLAQYTKTYGTTDTYFDKAACRNPAGFGWVNYLGRGVLHVMRCPQGSFSVGGDNSTCTACPTWMSTSIANSTSSSSCVAPPGFTSTGSSSPAQKCASGKFKDTYGNSDCTACGDLSPGTLWRSESTVTITFYNHLTMQQSPEKAPAAASSCYLPPGAGTTGSVAGNLTAVACNSNNHGAAIRTYGRGDTNCSTCATNLVTSCSTVTDATAKTACEGALAGYKDPVSAGFTSELACRTQAGWGWNGMAAYQCGGRTYSTGGHRSDCTPCPVAAEGFENMTSFTSVTECFKLSPGYAAFDVYGQIILTTVANSSLLSTVGGATKCPVGYWCAGGYLSAAAAVPQACGDGLTTKTNATDDGLGASAASRCVAPAGFGCTGACTTATACADGSFKATYDNTACTRCGTDGAAQATWHSLSPATSASACYVLPGLGLLSGALETCAPNKFGSATVQFGQAPAICSLCPTDMVTSCGSVVSTAPTKAGCEIDLARATDPVTSGYTSAIACRTQPGNGFNGTTSSVCTGRTYSYGGHRQPCSNCPVSGAGFAETNNAAATPDFCYILTAGYAAADSSGTAFTATPTYADIQKAVPCPANYWCPGGNPVLNANALPQACTVPATTNGTTGNDAASDCVV